MSDAARVTKGEWIPSMISPGLVFLGSKTISRSAPDFTVDEPGSLPFLRLRGDVQCDTPPIKVVAGFLAAESDRPSAGTAHMFFSSTQPLCRPCARLFCADGVGAREKALKAVPLQRRRLPGPLHTQMAGLPVTIRLLDIRPLHEFLPSASTNLLVELAS